MPAWATISITLGVGVLGVLGTLAGTWFQARLSRADREAAERSRWRERGAEVAAPLLALVEEADPLRLGLHLEIWPEHMRDLWERWRVLGDQLTVFAAAHPSDEIGKTVAEITKAIPEALINAEWFVGEYVGPKGTEGRENVRAEAQESHERARQVAQKLLAEIRAFAGTGGEPTA